MKYYKIINNNEFIGIACSMNFIRYSPKALCFLRADDTSGEYIDVNNNLYRDTWMAPIVKLESYIEAIIVEISEEEYEIYELALEKDETIITIPPEEEEDIEEETNPIDQTSLEFIRSSKLNEMSLACRRTIESGFDLVIRGETRHFSLTTQDQLNLMSLGAMTQTQSLIPYHADGEESEFYTAEEINQIISAAASFKNYQLSYYNSLKTYINTLDTIEAIAAITYGTPIPDEYKSDVLKVLE